jgi:hypothetical protein
LPFSSLFPTASVLLRQFFLEFVETFPWGLLMVGTYF